MSHQFKNHLILITTVIVLMLFTPFLSNAQPAAFTFQGRLDDGGTAANGTYDLQFALFDSLAGGAQVGSTQTVPGVLVSAGIFSVSLDFGASAFSGANRWLEIRARLINTPSYTTLSPRQAITSTPYAIRSLNASSADTVIVNGVPAGSGNYIQNATSPQPNSNFNISGNGTAGGTLSGGSVNATTQYNLGGSRILSADGTSGNMFAGFSAGQAITTGFGNTFIGFQAGLFTTTGSNNSFFGDQAGRLNTSGNHNTFVGRRTGLSNLSGSDNTLLGNLAVVGVSNLTNATAIGAYAQVDQSNSLVLGGVAGTNGVTTSVNVGIGTTTPTAALDVIGNGVFRPAGLASPRGTSLGSPNGETGMTIHGPANRADVRFDGGTLKLVAALNSVPPAATSGIAITTAGDVGIGITAPITKLDVNGSVRIILAQGGSQNVCLTGLTGIGLLAQCGSSLRYKASVRPFIGGLDLIRRLRPISFTWKADGSRDLGLGAEDVAKVEPLLITHNDNGEIEGVRYDRLNVVLINAIKQQQEQISRQQQQIEQLQGQQKLITQQEVLLTDQQLQITSLKKLVCRNRRRTGACK